MTTAGSVEQKVWTEAELEALPDDGYIHEVIDGELVMSPKNDSYHGRICAQLLIALGTFVMARKLGAVWDSSTGFWMHNRNCRAPDVSFISKERLQALGFKTTDRSFIPGAPDLAVEVLSPNNTRKEIDERLRDFFASGTQIAWIINPDAECVEVCHALDRRKLLGSGADLDGEHLLPGFRYPIADLFKGWDWE
jgi:Uma2 family endonuclease